MADESTAVAERGSKGEEVAGLREDAAPAQPAQPPAPPVGNPQLLALGDFLAKQGAIGDKARAQAEAMRPKVEAAAQQGQDFAAQAKEMLPPPPTLPPPPSRQLHGFLAPAANETPEASVGKFITALGVFASSAAGLMAGNARGSLAALTGALQGWHEGDVEKADREFADWKAKTDTLLKDFDNRRASWEDWFKASRLSLDQRLKGIELQMRADGMELDAQKLEAEGPKYLFETLDGWRQQREQLDVLKGRIELQRETAQNTKEYHAARIAIEQGKRDDAKKAADAQLAAYDNPETLAMLGQQYAITGKLPPNIARGKSGQTIIPKIVAAAAEWARGQGIDPMQLPAVRAEVESAQKSLTDTKKRHAVAEVAVGTFERHMTQLVELGRKVDRTNRPVVNRVILKARGQYGGDADVAAYEALALEAGQEFAKVSVGTAQGDANTREEARKAINAALNQQQLERVADELKRAAHRRMEQYRETEARLMQTIQAPMQPQADPRAGAPASGAAPAGSVVIKNKKTGERRGAPPGFDAAKYPEWEVVK